MAHLLLIEGDPRHWARLAEALESTGFRVTRRVGFEDLGAEQLALFDGVLAQVEASRQIEALLRRTAAPLIALAARGSVRQAVRAMRLGAADYLQLPVEAGELIAAVRQALSADGRKSAAGRFLPSPLIGSGLAMRALRAGIAKAAATDAPVLIEGESGVGKALVARTLHAASKRSAASLISVNCAQIRQSMLEDELFGHELPGGGAGSGLIQAASGGSLFLDEVGALPQAAQARLLRLLEKSEAPRPDSPAAPSDARILAATHQNLKLLADRGQFRGDLHDRLNSVSLAVPPLRERREDIPELARHFLAKACAKLGKPLPALSEAALEAMHACRWSGNVLELENAIERAAILCDGERVGAELLAIVPSPLPAAETAPLQAESLSMEEYFVRFVRENEDQMSETELAERLGISRKSLWERRKRLGIPRRKTRKRGPRRPGHQAAQAL